jgi:hypothetical protein
LQDSYASDDHAKELIAKLTVTDSTESQYSWRNGLLRYKNRIWVGSSPELQGKLIATFHESAVGGHSGFPVTYQRLKQHFAWKGMKAAVNNYV